MLKTENFIKDLLGTLRNEKSQIILGHKNSNIYGGGVLPSTVRFSSVKLLMLFWMEIRTLESELMKVLSYQTVNYFQLHRIRSTSRWNIVPRSKLSSQCHRFPHVGHQCSIFVRTREFEALFITSGTPLKWLFSSWKIHINERND